MINAITNVELVVVDKQKQSVADALSPDSAFTDHTTTTREISVNFNTTLTWIAWCTFVFTATIANNSVIISHTLTDLVKINSIKHNLNTAGTSVVGYAFETYSVNYPSLLV